ncbi:hypothetical protein NFI96_018363 [Prochilodus magdalenae]|nr:hypothetical protein NFI96_018363 [Prochilodus magdalenae]
MEGSETSMRRFSRTIWTVWGFLSGAVGRYLRPDVPNEDDQNDQQEEPVTKSYRELKEKKEEKDRACSQSERPQGGVSVRAAAVQWEKGKVSKEHTSRPAHSGVAWNAGVQDGHPEDLDKKAQEQRDHEPTSDDSNEAARARDADAGVEPVHPSASADGSQDFGVSGSAEEDVDARRSEDEVGDLVKSERAESAEQGQPEQPNEDDSGDTGEASVEKVMGPTDQDRNEEPESDEETGDGPAKGNADDLVSQLTCSTRERGDLSNKDLKVEPTEIEATPTPEGEVIEVGTKQETVGTVKDDYAEFTEGVVETECDLLEEPEDLGEPGEPIANYKEHAAGQQFNHSPAAKSLDICDSKPDEAHTECPEGIAEAYKLSEEPVTEQIENVEVYEREPTPEGDELDAISEETEQVAADGQQEAAQQVSEGSESPDRLDIHVSLGETQLEERVEATCEPVEEPGREQTEPEPEPISRMTEIRTSSSPVREPISYIEEHEAEQQFSESRAAEIVDVSESHLDEDRAEFAEAIVQTKHEALGEPETEQMSETEPEPISRMTEIRTSLPEREPIDADGEATQVEAGQQFSESRAGEIVDVSESHLDEDHTGVTEGTMETGCELLEELLTAQMENAELFRKDLEPVSKPTEISSEPAPEREATDEEPNQEAVGTVEDGQHEAGQQLGESRGSEITDRLDVHEPTVPFEERVEATCEPLEEPMRGLVQNSEMHEPEPEPISNIVENRTSSSPVREPIDYIQEHEVQQQVSESRADEILDVCESHLDEDHTGVTEGTMETACELLEEPLTAQMENADLEPVSKPTEISAEPAPEREATDVNNEEPNQETAGTVEDGQHEAGQQLGESRGSENADRLDVHESTVQFEERVEATCEPVEEPGREQTEPEPEPTSKMNETRTSSSPVREQIDYIEEHEAEQQVSESRAVEIVDVSESHLDEDHTGVTEGTMETACELLEEPLTAQMENAELFEKDLEPVSKPTEISAEPAPEREATDEEPNQETAGTVEDGQHKVGQQLGESRGSENADRLDVHESTDEAQFEEVVEATCEHGEELDPEPISNITENGTPSPVRESDGYSEEHEAEQQFSESRAVCESGLGEDLAEFTEAIAEAKHEPLEEQMEITELFGNDLEPVRPTPEGEAVDVSNEEQETVGAVQDGLHEAGQRFSESTAAATVDLSEPQLDEAQWTEETVTSECISLEETAHIYEQGSQAVSRIDLEVKVTSGDESVDSGTSLSAVDDGEEPADHVGGAVTVEMVIEQDNESVDAGPGNQTETVATTSKFHQAREEAVADDVKKSTERSSQVQLAARGELALQEAMDQSSLQQEMSDEEGAPVQALVQQEHETSLNQNPDPSPQEPDGSVAAQAELITELIVETKACCAEQKVEALETHVESTAKTDQTTAEVKCERAEPEADAITESESSVVAVETLEMLKPSAEPEASVRGEGQIPLSHGEPRGDQNERSRLSSLPEEELADRQTSEIQRSLQEDTKEALSMIETRADTESPDEAEIGTQDDVKIMAASVGIVEDIMSALSQNLQEWQSSPSKGPDDQTITKEEGRSAETSESESASLLTSHTVEDRKQSSEDTMDVETEACGEMPQTAADVDSNANIQERSRPALKRGSEKMTRDEEDGLSGSGSWAATDLLPHQVSSLDCTVQKSKLAVKNPLVRPPKDPRTLINMASVEPLAPARPSQPGLLRLGQGVPLPGLQKGVPLPGLQKGVPLPGLQKGVPLPGLQKGVIGFKLPGLGAGLPVLRKTDAGKKLRDEEETESASTQTETSDSQTEPKEDCVKQEQPATKPKWTPPRHPGMGGPLMMSELKSKLKKPAKD